MRHVLSKTLLSVVLSLITLTAFAGLDHVTTGTNWTYEGAHGPSHWGELSQKYKLCEKGHRQSPINVVTGETKRRQHNIEFHYVKAPITIVNTTKTLKLLYTDEHTKQYVTYDKIRYYLVNIHIHQPSEHMIDGRGFPLEVHMVHETTQHRYLVVAVFMKPGKLNKFLQQEFKAMPKKPGIVRHLESVQLNPGDLLPKSKLHYTFMGSLTTPPCTEGVRWVLLRKTQFASQDQINFYQKHITTYNNRPLQPSNHRKIDMSQRSNQPLS